MGSQSQLKQTSLHAEHLKAGAKMVDFGGWHMPIQYSGVIKEHQAVRTNCGVFDVSHMGELRVKGKDAVEFLQKVTINDVSKLAEGQGQYTAFLNESGGMVDDLILYQLASQDYLLCVNAANTQKDFDWICAQSEKASFADLSIQNESSVWSQLAVQGPLSRECLSKALPVTAAILPTLDYMNIASVQWGENEVLVARTGYTGEHGYEVYLPNKLAPKLFTALIEVGVTPIGLGARDTLRLEACYLLYGNDMDDTVSPIEAGIGWAVKLDKGEFVGRDRILKDKDPENKHRRKMVGFIMQEKAIPRAGMELYKGEQLVGLVTSGSFLPSLEQSGGMALVDKTAVAVDDEIQVDVRGKRKLAKIVKRPLYSPKVK